MDVYFNDSCCSEENTEISDCKISIDKEEHQDNHKECPPLCNCACCIPIIPYTFHQISFNYYTQVEYFQRNIVFESITMPLFYFQEIWHPPKVFINF